jgi:nitroreductase
MDKQIDQETLIEIVKDAQMTPSWANSQPWCVYIATGETLKQIQKAHLAYA